MSSNQDQPTPTIQNILLTHKKYNYQGKLPDLESTKESQELLKLERKLAKNLLAILRFMFNKEGLKDSTTITKPKITDLKRKYGFLFTSVLRSTIEEVYRLGGSYGIKFDELPSLTYFTTEADLVLIRQYTQQYHQRIWFRIDKFWLNRVPDASPIKGSFIIEILAAEICTFVMMEATKEKTRQIITIMDRNNPNPSLTVESASNEGATSSAFNTKKDNDLSTKTTESGSSMNPVLGYGPESIQALLAIKGFSEIKENSDFNTVFDYVSDDSFFTNVMRDRYFFMWMTARDDKVCKKYCRPLDGVIWTLKEINVMPLPDQLTHPRCRCRIIKVRI